MSPDPLTPKLREAVRERVLAADDSVSADWYLCSAVAGMLGVSTAQQTPSQRFDWDKFCQRVKRALGRLTTDGTLAKVPAAGGRVKYVRAELQREREAEAAQRAADFAAEQAMWKRIAGELGMYGLASEAPAGASIQLSTDDWQRILRKLDSAAESS